MAEPFAAGVLNSLLQPRIAQLGALTRVARAASQPALKSVTFFTPAPRQGKQHDQTNASPGAVEQHILGYQAWACPSLKQELWGHDGLMRAALMSEITPVPSRGRTRRTSKSSRIRFLQILAPESSRRYHVSSPHSNQPALDYSHGQPSVAPDTPRVKTKYTENKYPSWISSNRGQRFPKKYKGLFNVIQFAQLQASGHFRRIATNELLDIAKALTANTDGLCGGKFNKSDTRQWGENILYLIELVKTNASTSTSLPDQELVEALTARAHAFIGDFEEAGSFIYRHAEDNIRRCVTSQNAIDSLYFYHVLTSIVLALWTHRSYEAATVFLFEVSYPRWQLFEVGVNKFLVDQKLRKMLLTLNVQSLKKHIADWDPRRHDELFNFLLTVFNGSGDFPKAYKLVMALSDMQHFCSPALVAESVLGLLAMDDSNARTLFHILPPDAPDYIALQKLIEPNRPISLAQSLISEARSVFRNLSHDAVPVPNIPRTDPTLENSSPSDEDILADKPFTPLQPQARFKATLEAFEAEYPKGPNGIRNPYPQLHVYYSLAMTLRKAQNHPGVIELWEDMKQQSVRANIAFLTIVLASYRSLWDSQSILGLFAYMKENDLAGDNKFYTALIRYFASSMDMIAAEEAYDHAITQGVVPDLGLQLSLMMTYMKCGAWKKGIDMFTELRSSGIKFNVAAYNVILEGCIFIGAPFKTVLRLFARLEMEGITPDKYTYSILMHHAMIGGHFPFAQALYQDLLQMDAENPKDSRNVDITLITIMIRGFLHGHRHKEAKEMITEMKRLGQQHTAITHSTITRAYTASGNEEDLQLAEEYIYDVVSDPNDYSWRVHDTGRMRKDPLAMMFAPLISARVEAGDMESVERLVGQFLNAGGVPSIGILRHLLTAYSHSEQLDNFRTVWDQIIELAMKAQLRAPVGASAQISTAMRNITAPLDIYTRVMSQRGYHQELARTWGALMDAGAEFDEDNWNSYVYACLRAGEIGRAFEIIEHIIQPNFNVGLRNHFKATLPAELGYTEKLSALEAMRQGPPARPLMTEIQRKRAAFINRATNYKRKEFIDPSAIAMDFAYPLRALRKMGPGWHDWRPMHAVLEALLMALLYLEDGLPLRALQPGEAKRFDIAIAETEDRSVTEPLLRFLYNKHPRTLHRMMLFRYRERNQLGAREFRQKYIWSR